MTRVSTTELSHTGTACSAGAAEHPDVSCLMHHLGLTEPSPFLALRKASSLEM